MNYDFFADYNDKVKILEIIFSETDLQIFDLASNYSEEIKEYKNVAELTTFNDLTKATYLQLWSPRHKGKPIKRKIELNPKYCNGHNYRFSFDGLGLIQLFFESVQNNELKHSHLGHFNEKSAEKNQTENDKFEDWDWKEIFKTSRKLKYQIGKQLSVEKIGSYDVLENANKLIKSGIKYR